jgi:hypothetical protein
MAHVEPDGATNALLLEAIDALQKAEDLLAKLDRGGALKLLDELRETIESFPQVQLDMRIARMRLTAQLSHDPNKTPVEPVVAYRPQSSAALRQTVITPQRYEDEDETSKPKKG